MRRKIPGIAALMAFEAAARHQNFSRAAEELALTQSAVCRQIAALERNLGLKLFNRVKKRVTLTDAGRLYSERIGANLDQIERNTLDIMAYEGGGGIVELAVLPTFANVWLIPRLSAFAAAHSNITINMTAKSGMFLFSDTPFDAAIHFGHPTWPGTLAEYLFGEEMVPVCSPTLLGQARPLDARRLADYPLLHLSTRPDAWPQWFAAAGVLDVNAMKGPRYELFSMLIGAARSHLGIALVPRFMVVGELRADKLVVPFDLALPSDKGYYLVYPEHKKESAILQTFRAWLVGMAEQYRAEPVA